MCPGCSAERATPCRPLGCLASLICAKGPTESRCFLRRMGLRSRQEGTRTHPISTTPLGRGCKCEQSTLARERSQWPNNQGVECVCCGTFAHEGRNATRAQ